MNLVKSFQREEEKRRKLFGHVSGNKRRTKGSKKFDKKKQAEMKKLMHKRN